MTSCLGHAKLFTSVTVLACVSVSMCVFQDVGAALPPTSETGNLKPLSLQSQTEQSHAHCVCVCVCVELLIIFINAHQEGITEALDC